MNLFIYFIAAIVMMMMNSSSILAEIYKTYPHEAYHFSYPPYHDKSNVHTGITENGLPALSGPIVYDAKLDAANNGTVLLAPVSFEVNGTDSGVGFYPYSVAGFNHVKFTISSNETTTVTNGLATFTATFYAGVFTLSSFGSSTFGSRSTGSIDFSLTPASFTISAFIADDNNDWNGWLQPENLNNNDFFRTTPYNGMGGVLGLNNNDTEGAGIELFNLRGILNMTTQYYDAGGQPIGSSQDILTNPFNLRTYAVVPELNSLSMTAAVGSLLTTFVARNRKQRVTAI